MPLPPTVTVEVPRADGGLLVVDDAAAMAEVFFATEISSLGPGSYDARTLTTHPEQLDREDITVLNRSFRAMIMKTQLWSPLMEAGDLPWLTALDRDWDLVTMREADWQRLKVLDRITEGVEAVVSVKGRGVAQPTKLLHLKRPRLVPVIDSFVARAMGAPLSAEASAAVRVGQARRILEHFRVAAGHARPQLERVDAHLRTAGIERSLLRILDALIWCSEAEAWVELGAVLKRWRRPV
jgi:antitoxin (DNA-binding transcriptional repressor) of toxin-antitoxin stability system